MLDKLITNIVCLYKTLYQVMPVVCTNRITTRRDTHSDTGSHNTLIRYYREKKISTLFRHQTLHLCSGFIGDPLGQ
jgi:hypothetical protein